MNGNVEKATVKFSSDVRIITDAQHADYGRPPLSPGVKDKELDDVFIALPVQSLNVPAEDPDNSIFYFAVVILSVLSCVGGCWPVFICTLLGFSLRRKANDEHLQGNYESAHRFRQWSLALVATAIFFLVITLFGVFIIVFYILTRPENRVDDTRCTYMFIPQYDAYGFHC